MHNFYIVPKFKNIYGMLQFKATFLNLKPFFPLQYGEICSEFSVSKVRALITSNLMDSQFQLFVDNQTEEGGGISQVVPCSYLEVFSNYILLKVCQKTRFVR